MAVFLLKTGKFDLWTQGEVRLPRRAFPTRLPGRDDRLLVWDNERGLVGECSVVSYGDQLLSYERGTAYDAVLAASWLTGADREKTTVRSRLHCDRHDRLWLLDEAGVAEIESARRQAL